MAFTALERLLAPERIQQRAGRVGHSVPALQERPGSQEEAPFLASNMKREFLPTRISSTGVVRFGFSRVPLGDDDLLLLPLHQAILSQTQADRCTSLGEAMTRLRTHNLEPRTIVIPESWLPEICGPTFDITTAKTLMGSQGYVTKLDDMQVLVAPLPDDKAFVATTPALVGIYTRIADYLGLLLFRADRAIVAVTRGVGG